MLKSFFGRQSLTTLLVGLVVWIWSANVYAQPDTLWTRTYGGPAVDNGYSVVQTTDGGYIMTGRTRSFGAGGDDVWLIKTDSLGDTLWTRTFGGTSGDCGYSVVQTSDGGYVIAGETASYGAGGYDVWLIRTDSLGDTLWTRTFGGGSNDHGRSVQECTAGGFIIAGETGSYPGYFQVFLIRVDSLGDTLWIKTYGGSNGDYGWSVQECTEGGFIIAGETNSFGAGLLDVYLIRVDSLGDTLWTKTYGGSDYDGGYSVQECTAGGFIIAGYTYSFGAGQDDVYLVRTDSEGDTLWTMTYGGSNYDLGHSVHECSDGGFMVAGYTYSFGAGQDDVYLVRTDSEGDTLWTKTYGGGYSDDGRSVVPTSDGGYIVTGSTKSYGLGNYDVWLLRLSPELIPGDANGDGEVNMSDLIYVANYLFAGGPPPDPLLSGDVNGDCLVNIGDVTYLANYLFAGGPPPVPCGDLR